MLSVVVDHPLFMERPLTTQKKVLFSDKVCCMLLVFENATITKWRYRYLRQKVELGLHSCVTSKMIEMR